MIIIGITGGMGSGKTLVSKMLGDLGPKIIEADKVAKDLYFTQPHLKDKIVEAFGFDILDEDGEIAFKKLALTAFKDIESVTLLNEITHPFIRDAIRHLIVDIAMTNKIIVVDAALLFEGELLYTVDYIITVTAPEEERVRRIVASGRFSEDEVRKRMSYQIPEEEKASLSDFVIPNTGTIDDLRIEVQKVYKKINDNLS